MRTKNTRQAFTFLDLFCGCGGFTLGLERAGFHCLAALDFNPEAITTFKGNFSKDTLALRKDLTKFSPAKLAAMIGVNSVDVIVGGPPCQGFSTVRQVDAANHGSRVRRDKRRYLYRIFLEYVAAFRPRVFVMENVLGIQSAAKGKFFTQVQAEARALGYRVQAQVEEAWKLGVPQKRRRQLVIGVRDDIPGYFPGELASARRSRREEAHSISAPDSQSLLTSAATRFMGSFDLQQWTRIGAMNRCFGSGTGVSPVRFDSNGRDARAITRFMERPPRTLCAPCALELKNIQHSTFNAQRRRCLPWRFEVEC